MHCFFYGASESYSSRHFLSQLFVFHPLLSPWLFYISSVCNYREGRKRLEKTQPKMNLIFFKIFMSLYKTLSAWNPPFSNKLCTLTEVQNHANSSHSRQKFKHLVLRGLVLKSTEEVMLLHSTFASRAYAGNPKKIQFWRSIFSLHYFVKLFCLAGIIVHTKMKL